jgi:acetyltransferase-like isoleucine patch superfamily enzyme
MKKNNPIINKIKIRNVIFGKNVKIVEPVNLYGCNIKDNVFIGPFVEIQENVKIAKFSHTLLYALW